MRVIFCCDIDPRTKIGDGTKFPHHAMGIVIHREAIIGNNCIIEQNVTIGGRSGLSVLPKMIIFASQNRKTNCYDNHYDRKTREQYPGADRQHRISPSCPADHGR